MIIPNDVVKALDELNTDRVIFLVMSTLPSFVQAQIETYVNRAQEDTYTFKGISQLEPGTKYFLQKLALEEKIVDRIVIVASEQTLASDENYMQKSAVDVYLTRLKEYMKIGKSISNFGKEDKDKSAPEAGFLGLKLYDVEDFFEKRVIIIKGSGMRRLWDARTAILGNAERTELYIDMQGGNRNDIPLFNTIMELLSDHNVTVSERVAVDYNSQNAKQEIQVVSKRYDSYDLVTAYQIFKQYGWGQQLAEFFKNSKGNAIAEAIVTVSEAIKLCDVEGFDEGLDALTEAIDLWKKESAADEKSEMDFLVDLILEDYGELLEDARFDKKPLKYVHQIRWCLKKNFVQQALTIFESKMPREFVWNAICYYCDADDNKEEILAKFDAIFQKHIKKSRDEAYRFTDINHYWIRDYFREHEEDKQIAKKSLCDSADDLIRIYAKLCKSRNQINHAAEKQYAEGGFTYLHKGVLPVTGRTLSVEEVASFLDRFEKAAAQIDESKKKAVVDLA